MVANAWPRQLNEYLSGAVAHGPSFSQPSHLRQLGGETSSSSAPIVQLWLANCHWPERRTGCRRIPAGVRLCLASRPGFEGPTSMRVVMAIACKNTIEHKKGGKRCHDPFSMRRPDNKKREPLPAVRPEINAAPLAQPNAESQLTKRKPRCGKEGRMGFVVKSLALAALVLQPAGPTYAKPLRSTLIPSSLADDEKRTHAESDG